MAVLIRVHLRASAVALSSLDYCCPNSCFPGKMSWRWQSPLWLRAAGSWRGFAARIVSSDPMVERLGPDDPGQGCVPAPIFSCSQNRLGLDADQPAHTLGHRVGGANVGDLRWLRNLGLRVQPALGAFAPSWRIRIWLRPCRAGFCRPDGMEHSVDTHHRPGYPAA